MTASQTTPSAQSPRTSMAVMSTCYALGTFTDNCYKQAAVFMAAAVHMTQIQSLATVLFSLPFILFSAWSGWLSDRQPKKRIIIAAKTLELAAMATGAYMLAYANWNGILTVMFLMAAQSALFSPAINGSIPENFAPENVPKVNSLIKLASTIAILAGAALAGFLLDLRPPLFQGIAGNIVHSVEAQATVLGRITVGFTLTGVSLIGLLTAFLLRRGKREGHSRKNPFPWLGPVDSLRHALDCRRDASLWLVLIADAWFYGVAVVAVISIANLAAALGYTSTQAGLMTAALSIGVAAGALLAGRGNPENWRSILVPSACAMSFLLMLTACAPLFPNTSTLQQSWIYGCLFLCGASGGMYLIPLESFIQVRPAPDQKGKVIAVSNFLSFSAMLLFGAAFQYVGKLAPASTFSLYGIGTLTFALFFCRPRLARLKKISGNLREHSSSWVGYLLRALLSLRYRVTEKGLDSLAAPSNVLQHGRKESGILFLPNHPALIDPVLVYSRIAGITPLPLADARNMKGPLPWLAQRIVPTVTIADMEKDGRKGARSILAGISTVADALNRGENVLLYPAGRLMREKKENLRANSAVARILAEVPDARVVLVRTAGVWGSSFSRAENIAPRFGPTLFKGFVNLLANGIFFMPRREVTIEFTEPYDVPRGAHKLEINRYLEKFYNETAHEAAKIPYVFWRKRVDSFQK